jgi:hypothetical protein
MKTTEQHMTDLISRLREIEELLACRGSAMTPAIHGKASALVSIARSEAHALGRAMRVEIIGLRRELAEATGTEEEFYARMAHGVTE